MNDIFGLIENAVKGQVLKINGECMQCIGLIGLTDVSYVCSIKNVLFSLSLYNLHCIKLTCQICVKLVAVVYVLSYTLC